MPIIDVHAHTEFSLERLLRIHGSFKNIDLSKKKFLEEIKNLDIEYVLSIGKKDGLLRQFFDDSKIASRETLMEEKEAYPFLKRAIAINTENEGNLVLIKDYLKYGMVSAMKLYLGYTKVQAGSDVLNPYYDLALEHNIPVLIHLGNCYAQDSEKIAFPYEIMPVLETRPSQNFVLCHLGFPLVEETEKILTTFDNTYADVSGLLTHEDILKGELPDVTEKVRPALKRLLSDEKTSKKLMYGSDYPLTPLHEYFNVIKNIVTSNQEDLFYNNAKNFFKL